MKKILSLILCVIMAAGFGVSAFGADEITIYVNGSVVQSELKPVIISGNTLIPLRPVAEAMGCTVTWVAEEKGIKIEAENISVRMVVDYGVIYTTKNNSIETSTQTLSVPPQIINGSTYIPMRPMVEALGGEVDWDGNTKTIKITYDVNSTGSSYTSDIAQGKLFYDNETITGEYVGEISNGDANGTGVMTYSNGDVYEGEFKDGYRHGTGTYKSGIGEVYEGEWLNGKRSGTGTMAYSDGSVYEGEWLNDQRNGTGTMKFANGNVYEGEWLNGKRSGTGKMTKTDGEVYEGEWLNNNINGKGKKTYPDGTVEEGTWKNGAFIG